MFTKQSGLCKKRCSCNNLLKFRVKLLRKFVKSKKLIIVSRSVFTSQRPLVIEDLSTSHFPVGLQSLGLIREKGSMVTERAIELVQERLHEYALSIMMTLCPL